MHRSGCTFGSSVRRGIATFGGVALGLTALGVATAGPAVASSIDVNAAIGALNAGRAKVGCPSLAANGILIGTAQAHAADIAGSKRAVTAGSDRSTPGKRIADAGYAASLTAENVLATPATADSTDVVNAWLHSDSQKSAILNCKFTDAGLAFVSGGDSKSYWVLDLARPA